MGHSFPFELALALKKRLSIKTFIETGTYKGQTALWAADHFEQVHSVEASLSRYQKTYASISPRSNLALLYGNSANVLPNLLGEIAEPVLFWLDAHWMDGGERGKLDECPLRQELMAINMHPYAARHVLIIDDARLFIQPPPAPHDPSQWPGIGEVKTELLRMPRHVVIWNDMIIAVPMAAVELVEGYTNVKAKL